MTHYIGNIRVHTNRDTVTIVVKNPQHWDNEPSETSVSFPVSDIGNLIEALQSAKSEHADYASWGDPWGRR